MSRSCCLCSIFCINVMNIALFFATRTDERGATSQRSTDARRARINEPDSGADAWRLVALRNAYENVESIVVVVIVIVVVIVVVVIVVVVVAIIVKLSFDNAQK